jgi:hypothetical protein
MKNSNDTIGNRSRDLPVCSAVSQPLRHQQRAPKTEYLNINIKLQINISISQYMCKKFRNEVIILEI